MERYAKQELVRRLLFLKATLITANIPSKILDDVIAYISKDNK